MELLISSSIVSHGKTIKKFISSVGEIAPSVFIYAAFIAANTLRQVIRKIKLNEGCFCWAVRRAI